MSRIFTDPDLLTWEAYASGGAFGLPERPKIVFNCLSKPGSRGKFVAHSGDNADAAAFVHSAPAEQLQELLAIAVSLD